MSVFIRLNENIIDVECNDGVFVGHLDNHILFSDSSVRSLLRELRNWVNVKELLEHTSITPALLYETINALDVRGFIETRTSQTLNQEITISHLNEIGLVISGILSESGVVTHTLDKRLASLSDVRGQFVKISNLGESFHAILDSQKREIINSGKKYFDGVKTPEELSSLVLITTYPEPELLAYLMGEGINHLIVLATANGAQIGPFVAPGHTPCFHCYEIHRSDEDDQWSKVATTLFSRRFAPIPMERAMMISALIAPLLLNNPVTAFAAKTPGYLEISFSQNSESGTWNLREENHTGAFHPECSCHWSRSLSTRAL